MLIDPRIGTYDGEEPMTCAVSGQDVRGRPSAQFPLDKQHYYRVLAKCQNEAGEAPNRADLETELRGVIAGAVTAEAAPKAFPELVIDPPATRRVRAGEERES